MRRRCRQKISAAADRALLKGAPKQKIVATWAPWTSPRLAFASGYGAGVAAPGWCAHLWDTPRAEIATRWLARIAAALREDGHLVSTASLIEAERLAVSLAAMRDRPAPGFEELREAAIACLCFGEALVWETISQRLLIGAEVGSIPDNVPLAPLLEDLQREQKRVRLKPEALDRELAVDLRSDSGARPLDAAASSCSARRPLGQADRRRPQPRHLPRALGAALGAGVRGSAGAKTWSTAPTIAQAAAGRMRADLSTRRPN